MSAIGASTLIRARFGIPIDHDAGRERSAQLRAQGSSRSADGDRCGGALVATASAAAAPAEPEAVPAPKEEPAAKPAKAPKKETKVEEKAEDDVFDFDEEDDDLF